MRKRHFDDVVSRLDLPGFIRRWNAAGGSKIASFSDLMAAITMDEEMDQGFADAIAETDRLGLEDFDEEIRYRVEPVIVGTLVLGMNEETRAWAYQVASRGPSAYNMQRPFAALEDWVEWTLEHVDRPVTICGPDGSDIVEDDVLTVLLRQALHAERPTAWHAGWFQSPAGTGMVSRA